MCQVGAVWADWMNIKPSDPVLDQRCYPNGVPFDRDGNPRERYAKVSLDGTYCIVPPAEVASIIGDDDHSAYVVTDVFYSRQELEAMPEFTGF